MEKWDGSVAGFPISRPRLFPAMPFLGFGFAVAEENMRARCFREKRFAGWLAADVGRRGWLFYGVFPFEKKFKC